MRRFGQLATRLCRSHGTVRPSVIRGPSGNPAQAHPIFSRGCIRHLSNDSNVLGEPLETEPWPFNSALLDTEKLMRIVNDSSDFTTRLLVTLLKLRTEGKSSVWVRVPLLQSHLISILAIHGFRYHHTDPENAYLNLWLQRSENKIPPFATHLVGVAGLVLNSSNEVLMVKEQSKKYAGWKLPGGYANLGEELGVAACREVLEETGVKTEFNSILSFRHQHNVSFGRSDIYVICRLKALSEHIVIDAHEIEDARWTPIERFRNDAATHPILRVVSQLSLNFEKDDPDYPTASDIVETEHPSIIPGRPPFKLYHRPLPVAASK